MRIKCPSLSICVLELIDFCPTSDHFNFTHHCTCVNTVSLCLFRWSLVFSVFFLLCCFSLWLSFSPHMTLTFTCFLKSMFLMFISQPVTSHKIVNWTGKKTETKVKKLVCAVSEGTSFFSHCENMYIFKWYSKTRVEVRFQLTKPLTPFIPV